MDRRVAVSISGGGYRASAWGLGVLWAVVDAGLNPDVTMVSSVSGGSLTNAHAGLGPGLRALAPAEFATRAGPLFDRLVGRPAAWLSSLLATVAAWIVVTVALATDRPVLAAIAAGAGLVASLAGAATSGDLLFNRVETWLFIDLLLGLAALAVCVSGPVPTLGAVVLLGAVALLRGPVVGWSMGRSLATLSPDRSYTLGGLNPEPQHAFLATELRAGHHAVFARDFVYCHDFGLGSKPSLPVRVAVQASANLPGAFPTRWVPTAGMGLRGADETAKWLALSDGGVYDNMGDQWPVFLGDRIARLTKRPEIGGHPPSVAVVADWKARLPTFVIIANASGALGFRRVSKGAVPLLGELFGLFQVKDVLYDNGNRVRRQRLIEMFDAQTPAGTLIHIASSPYEYPRVPSFAGTPEAAASEAWLNAQMGADEWERHVTVAQAVGTQLWPLGRDKAVAVVRTAYAQTIVNLHLKLGTPLHALPPL